MSLLTIPFSTNAKYVQKRGPVVDPELPRKCVPGVTIEPTEPAVEQLAHPVSTERDPLLTDRYCWPPAWDCPGPGNRQVKLPLLLVLGSPSMAINSTAGTPCQLAVRELTSLLLGTLAHADKPTKIAIESRRIIVLSQFVDDIILAPSAWTRRSSCWDRSRSH